MALLQNILKSIHKFHNVLKKSMEKTRNFITFSSSLLCKKNVHTILFFKLTFKKEIPFEKVGQIHYIIIISSSKEGHKKST